MYPLGGPEADAVDDAGLQSRMVTVRDLSTLEGQGLSMVLVNLEACAINFAHSHPRAAQASTVLLYTADDDTAVLSRDLVCSSRPLCTD